MAFEQTGVYTPEDYQRERNRMLRDALDRVQIHPGPMFMVDADTEVDEEGIRPWRIWKVKDRAPKFDARAYVEANTAYDSSELNISEILRDAEWPEIKRGIAWLNALLVSSLFLLILYLLALQR